MSVPVRLVKDLIEFSDTIPDNQGVGLKVFSYGKIKNTYWLAKDIIKTVEIIQYRNLEDYFSDGSGDPVSRLFGRTNLPAEIEFFLNQEEEYPSLFVH
ncbi:hypothetical protein [Fluviicola taffensis]|uniref:Uncharacterized protein n=1 Tax=Fluviicola taffensis (strain DSM 16823 / NCIMB 13979 / RW262) TaxID=755732 RepID=F2IE87_FLUTR|nr:hypothetical protein [Fluviicola taffensis]AEA42405.1 hypothetical protein Fluta_0397 [Fluviicola taffensis DSM 16823]